ncbi:5654_t:CDS:2, partial [Paraglomus occultum]
MLQPIEKQRASLKPESSQARRKSYREFRKKYKKITKEYGREIIQEGSTLVLGLADHFDEIVAKAMNVEKELITLARQWHITLERAAFTEGVDKVKEVLEREQEATTTQQENIKEVVEEVEMRIEEERITETKKIMEVKPAKPTRQDLQHQETADNTTKKEGKNKVLEGNSIEIFPCKNKIEDKLEQLEEIGKARYGKYEEAKAKLEKKKDEFDQLNLILEEKTEKENPKKRKVLQNEKKTKEARETQAKQELEEVQKKRATLSDQTEKREYSTSSSSRKRKEVLSERTEDKKISPVKDKGKRKMYEPETSLKEKEDSHKSNDLDREQKPYSRIEETITVWNIPYHITRSQVFFAIKYLERVKNIEMIRESSGKTRAEVSFEEGSSFIQGIETWIVPLTNELLSSYTYDAIRIQKEKELWIAFQDMRKAFDSVSIHALELSMRRIRLPKNLITFIKQLYQNCEIRVITDEGLIDFFVAGDGIDQGEVISLLMWRIFYDPLLVEKRVYRTEKAMISALAYADDTTWVVESQQALQEIIR